MIKPSPDDKVYPVIKLATVVDALAAEGIPAQDALESNVFARDADFAQSSDRMLSQCRQALARTSLFLSRRSAVSPLGLRDVWLRHPQQHELPSDDAICGKYHQLATPLAELHFKEQSGCGVWTIAPMPHSRIDGSLYKFLVEMQFGICVSLHRDVMGPLFAAREFDVTYRPPDDAAKYPDIFGCPVSFGEPENRLVFDATWLDCTPKLGNDITYASVVELCDRLMDELQLSAGVAGKVRQVLLTNLMRPRSFGDIASDVNMSERTLRRKLREENTSFRNLVDQLRMEMAIKYLRDTDLTVEAISESVGFSDAANFRQAFRRWTKAAPHAFRDISGKTVMPT